MELAALHPNVRIRIVVGFVQRLLDSMVMTFMAIYLASRYGTALAGVMVLVVVSLGVVGSLVGGHVSDQRGRRATLLMGEAAVFATFAVMSAANSPLWGSSFAVYLCYVANKFAASFAMPANDAMIVDVTTPETRKSVYTLNYWAINLALACGALVGAFLYNGHFDVLLGVAAAGVLGIFLTTVFLISETRPRANREQPAPSVVREFVAGYRPVLRDRMFRGLMIAATLGMTIDLQLIYYVGVRLAAQLPRQQLLPGDWWRLQVNGVEMLGVLRTENTALVVVLALVSHRVFRRLADSVRLYAGITTFVGGYMVLAVSNTGWILLVGGAVLTVGELMNVPVKQALLANMVPESGRTRYMAVYNLNIRLGLVLASLFITLGSVVPPWGIAACYGVIGVAILAQYRAILASPGPSRSNALSSPKLSASARAAQVPPVSSSRAPRRTTA